MKSIRQCALVAVVAMAATPQSVLACATCFGKSDSDLAKAMNWGIVSLLAVVVFVLGGIAAFFIYLARRATLTAATGTPVPEALPETSELIQR